MYQNVPLHIYFEDLLVVFHLEVKDLLIEIFFVYTWKEIPAIHKQIVEVVL